LRSMMAVAALIEDGPAARSGDRVRLVQTAKAVQDSPLGSHRQWEWPIDDGTTRSLNIHAYPKSSGIVLRLVGREIELGLTKGYVGQSASVITTYPQGLTISTVTSQERPSFFEHSYASKDYDGCDDADGSKWMRVTLFKEPLRPLDRSKNQIDQFDEK
jgi:hypothetical protein